MNRERKLISRLAALDSTCQKPIALQLEPGHVLRINGECADSGLVDILYQGRGYKVFFVDVMARSEVVHAAAAAAGA